MCVIPNDEPILFRSIYYCPEYMQYFVYLGNQKRNVQNLEKNANQGIVIICYCTHVRRL